MASVNSATLGAATPEERVTLAELKRLLNDPTSNPRLVSDEGTGIPLTVGARDALSKAVTLMEQGQAVEIVSRDRLRTSQQAANALGVSRPYLVQLLDRGVIPSTWTGKHRRVRLEDIVAYKVERDAQRRVHLSALKELSEELGLYAHDLAEARREAAPADNVPQNS